MSSVQPDQSLNSSSEHTGKLDLNLLVVFDAVMAEGSVKKAAVRLGMKAPAVSQALTRLREAVGGELFIRAGHGLKPTPRASNMWNGVKTALGMIKISVAGDVNFDPQHEQRIITLDLPSGADALIMPQLAKRMSEPSELSFRISSARAFNVLNDLRFGDSWLAIDYRQITEPGYHCEIVSEQEVAAMARKGHPALRNGLTAELYQRLPQVAISSLRNTSVLPVTERLAAIGMTRRLMYAVPGLLTAISLVSKADVICSLPICTIRHCQSIADFEMHKLPFELPKMSFFMVWHERFDNDAGHIWLRETIRSICAEF